MVERRTPVREVGGSILTLVAIVLQQNMFSHDAAQKMYAGSQIQKQGSSCMF